MFGKYLDKVDKNELKLRQEHINRQILVVKGLEELKIKWMASKFSKYGLDSSKQWGINPLTGKIIEVKKEKTK